MHEYLQKAVTRVLSPLVRMLLRHGVSHAQFALWAKQAYVEEAARNFGIDGKPPTQSRIAIVTGINRKEVKRISELAPDAARPAAKHNRAIRVVTGWLQDADFQDNDGNPAVLTYGDSDDAFNRLVRRYGGDVPARAVLDELLRVGTVATDGDDRVQLVTHGYVPHHSEEAMLDMFATSASDLLDTLEHNIDNQGRQRLQMSVAYDNVTRTGVERFRRLSAEQGMALLRSLDKALAEHDRDANPATEGEGRYRTGLGLYLIEQRLEDDNDDTSDKP